MSGRKKRSAADQRRRSLGQNFLVDEDLVARFIADLDLVEGEVVVELGAGSGALTLPLAQAGARVWAVERDPVWAERLTTAVDEAGLANQVRVIRSDLRGLRFPKEPCRVVANPPFNMTTKTLELILGNPAKVPLQRADLILQREVARKHAAKPPKSLKTASWAPWWEFSTGRAIPASAFRPRPSVEAAVLTVRRRQQPVLPTWLAAGFDDVLRAAWQPPQ